MSLLYNIKVVNITQWDGKLKQSNLKESSHYTSHKHFNENHVLIMLKGNVLLLK